MRYNPALHLTSCVAGFCMSEVRQTLGDFRKRSRSGAHSQVNSQLYRTRSMDLKRGFQIEKPRVFVPWGISEGELRKLLGSHLRHVTEGYYTISCKSLGGMQHELGFHFEPRKNGELHELEFFRRSYRDQEQSYREFQDHFEATFGQPTETEPGTEGFPSHEWRLNGATIRHYVFDRFGPEEHMRIWHHGFM